MRRGVRLPPRHPPPLPPPLSSPVRPRARPRRPRLLLQAAALTKEDVAFSNLLPEDKTLYPYDAAPKRSLSLDCLNVAGKSKASLSDLSRGGTKYVVLWFFPEDSGALNLEAANNAKEAQGFERLRAARPRSRWAAWAAAPSALMISTP